MSDPSKQKVNCRYYSNGEGGHRLVFLIDGTNESVGNIVLDADPRYILVMAELFNQWAHMERKQPLIASAVRSALNS